MNVRSITAGELTVGDVIVKRKERRAQPRQSRETDEQYTERLARVAARPSYVVDRKVTALTPCTSHRDNVHVNREHCYWQHGTVLVKDAS